MRYKSRVLTTIEKGPVLTASLWNLCSWKKKHQRYQTYNTKSHKKHSVLLRYSTDEMLCLKQTWNKTRPEVRRSALRYVCSRASGDQRERHRAKKRSRPTIGTDEQCCGHDRTRVRHGKYIKHYLLSRCNTVGQFHHAKNKKRCWHQGKTRGSGSKRNPTIEWEWDRQHMNSQARRGGCFPSFMGDRSHVNIA